MKASKCPHCANSKALTIEPSVSAPDAVLVVSCGHCRRVLGAAANAEPLVNEIQALRRELAELKQALGK